MLIGDWVCLVWLSRNPNDIVEMSVDGEEEGDELALNGFLDEHVVNATCFGGHRCFRGRSPFRRLN
jgi:hypothetical protein